MKIRTLLAHTRFLAKDNDGGGDPAPEPVSDPSQTPVDPTSATPTPEPDAEKTFTQAQVDEFVVKRNKAVRSELEKTEKQYEGLLKSSGLTTKEKTELQGQLEQLQMQLRTKEQQAAHEAKKAADTHKTAMESAATERDYFKNLFETETRDRAIMDAAIQNEAFNPELFISVIGPRTKVVEELNEQGEKTGRRVPRVEVTVTGEDGIPTVVLKTPAEAIEAMKEDPTKFGGLFRNNVAKGIGEGTSKDAVNPTRVDVTKVSDEEYFANIAEYRKQLGIKDRRQLGL